MQRPQFASPRLACRLVPLRLAARHYAFNSRLLTHVPVCLPAYLLPPVCSAGGDYFLGSNPLSPLKGTGDEGKLAPIAVECPLGSNGQRMTTLGRRAVSWRACGESRVASSTTSSSSWLAGICLLQVVQGITADSWPAAAVAALNSSAPSACCLRVLLQSTCPAPTMCSALTARQSISLHARRTHTAPGSRSSELGECGASAKHSRS
jgi:hypothetical protein